MKTSKAVMKAFCKWMQNPLRIDPWSQGELSNYADLRYHTTRYIDLYNDMHNHPPSDNVHIADAGLIADMFIAKWQIK